MKLVAEETLVGSCTEIGMTGMKESSDTTRMPQTIDQPGVLITEETLQGNSRKFLIKISDPLSVVLGGSPGIAESFAGSVVKKEAKQLRIYATY